MCNITTPEVLQKEASGSIRAERIKGMHVPAAITGKPVELGGCAVRSYSTSLGGVYVLEEALKRLGRNTAETGLLSRVSAT